MPDYKILCIHGIGHAEANQHWNQAWIDVLRRVFAEKLHTTDRLTFSTLPYDDIFAKYPDNIPQDGVAVAELIGSAAYHLITDPLQPRAFEPWNASKYFGRWFAGMVAQWVVEDRLREELRQVLTAAIQNWNPDIILAHSLGTLLSYDLFTHGDNGRNLIKDRIYITFGSQIGNTFVRAKMWGGRIPMVSAKRWYHLFNRFDPAFTAEIAEPGQATFLQVETDSPAGHNAVSVDGNPGYLDHPNTLTKVWEPLARGLNDTLTSRGFAAFLEAAKTPRRRALLVGINEYPDPAHKLSGCVNDVYSISALLQENGFSPDDITVLIDRRATKDAIVDRLKWLLSDADNGADRVLYYSGHGVQIPGRGTGGRIDHLEDGIVPVDFEWQKLNAVTDKDLFNLYSQLPVEAKFLAIFDCCFSGGLVRGQQGSARSLPVPAEIRHALQQWDRTERRWKRREFSPLLPDFEKSEQESYAGSNGATYKLGRAVPLRRETKQISVDLRRLRKHHGPYLPVVLEACSESQQSYEYADGAVTHGAFTMALVEAFRNPKNLTFSQLATLVAKRLKDLNIIQDPQVVGPTQVLERRIADWHQINGHARTGNANRTIGKPAHTR